MLQNSSATDIPIAETEERVGKIFRKILTRAHAKQTIGPTGKYCQTCE